MSCWPGSLVRRDVEDAVGLEVMMQGQRRESCPLVSPFGQSEAVVVVRCILTTGDGYVKSVLGGYTWHGRVHEG